MNPRERQGNQRIIAQTEGSVRDASERSSARGVDDARPGEPSRGGEPSLSIHESGSVEADRAQQQNGDPGGHRPDRRKRLLQRAEAFLIFLGSFVLAALVVRFRDAIELLLWTIGPLAYPLAIAVMAIVASAPFSVTDALAIMNGVIFGPLWGTVVNACGIVLAAIIGYQLARRTCTLLNIQQQIEKLPAWARRFPIGSPGFLVSVRIIPGLGGTVATQSAAAFRVPLFRHVWTMSIIAIPICTVLAIFGDQAADFVHERITVPVHHYYERARAHLPHLHHDAELPGKPEH